MLLRTLVQSHYKHIFGIHSLCLLRSPFAVFLTSVHCWHWWFTANAFVFAEISVRQHKTRYKSYGKFNQEIYSSNKNMKWCKAHVRNESLWRRPLRVTQMHTYHLLEAFAQRHTPQKIDIIRQNTNFLQCGCIWTEYYEHNMHLKIGSSLRLCCHIHNSLQLSNRDGWKMFYASISKH